MEDFFHTVYINVRNEDSGNISKGYINCKIVTDEKLDNKIGENYLLLINSFLFMKQLSEYCNKTDCMHERRYIIGVKDNEYYPILIHDEIGIIYFNSIESINKAIQILLKNNHDDKYWFNIYFKGV